MPRKRKVIVVNQENVEPTEKVAIVTKKNDKAEKPNKKQKLEPDWACGEGLEVLKVILSMQKSDCNANKCITELTKIYRKMDHKTFITAFNKMTRMFLNNDEGDEVATRVLKFIANFVASFGEEVDEKTGESHPIIQDLFKDILSLTSTQIYVRARLCSLVTQIMSAFSQKAEIDESIIDKIIDRMLFFMKDVSPNVRAQAVLGLQRLQDPDNPDDPVTKAYIYHMESDPAPKVRQSTITAIAKKLPNMQYIIERLQDVDEKVRRHTYLQMASFSVKSYKIADRIAILNIGLNDRSELVRKAVVNILLANWVGVYDYDYAELIRATKLDSTERELVKFRKLADQTLIEIFKKRKLSDMIAYLNLDKNPELKNCLKLEKSTLEMLLVWKAVAKFHQQYVEGRGRNIIRDALENSDDEEDNHMNATISNVEVLPELSIFCDYMTSFITGFKFGTDNDAKLSKIYFSQCIVVLLEIVQLNDLGDEVGKERLQELLKTILLEYDVSDYAIHEIARVTEQIIPSVDLRLKFFNGIVNEMVKIGAPSEQSRQKIIQDLINSSDIDTKVKANNIKLRMMDLKEQETTFAERKQYAECQKVKDEHDKLNIELIELLKPVAELHSVESSQSLSMLENLSTTTVKKLTQSDILKNLRICYYAINSKGVKVITHEVLSIYNEFARYHLESNDIYNRIWALKTATAYALLYESIAQEIFYHLKSQIFRNAHVLMWECAIDCIIDLLLRYGVDKMDNFDKLDGTNVSLSGIPSSGLINSSQNRSRRGGARTLYTDADGDDDDGIDEANIVKNLDIMQMLLHVIEQNVDKRIYKVTIIGICKLILHGVYCTRDVISKFLLMYFNPATDAEISQILGVFLENIIRRKKQEFLHDALHPTIVTLFEAPHDSPLREVKLETVLKYIVGATRPIFCSNGLNLHNTLGTKFLEFMQDNSESKDILKVFSKELLELEIGEDPLLKKDMIKNIDLLLKESSADPRTKKNLTDFKSILNGTYKVPLKFSSTAKITSVLPEEEEEDGLENIEEGNEEENTNDNQPPQEVSAKEEQEKKETPEPESTNTSLNTSPKKKLLDVSVVTPKRNITIQNETVDEVQEIPASPQHIEMPPTQIAHYEIPATQQLEHSVIESSIVSNESSIIPSTPATPVTVKPKRHRANQDHVEYPPTPTSTSRAKPANNAKRVLEISRSSPSTPSVSSPIRKVSKSVTPGTSKLSTSTPKPATPSTPQLETRMTRKQAKEEIAKNTTLTRSASKVLNIKSTRSSIEIPKKSSSAEKPAKALPPSKLPVKKTSTVAPTKSQRISATQSETSMNTRQMKTRGTSSQSATTLKATKAPGSKASTSRPPWK